MSVISLKALFSGGNKGIPKWNRVQGIHKVFPLFFSISLCTGTEKQDTVSDLWEELRAAVLKAT